MTVDTITHDDVIQEEPEELSEDEYYPEDMPSEDKIIIPSPKVSIDENDIPIIVRNTASFEERILEASPDAAVPLELTPCDICGRKFNPQALERHTKVTNNISLTQYNKYQNNTHSPPPYLVIKPNLRIIIAN